MSYIYAVLIYGVILAGMMALIAFLFTRFPWGSFALAFGTAFILFMFLWWMIMHNKTEDAANIWSLIIPGMLAFPASCLLPFCGGPYFYQKCIGLSFLGACQYGAIGFGIDYIIYKRKKKVSSLSENKAEE